MIEGYKMATDTEIVDWIDEHLDEVYTFGTQTEVIMAVKWSDLDGDTHETRGDNLRDVVRRAISGECCCS